MSPIRPENRGRYPADWPAISRRIRERARNRCERCHVPNYAVGTRERDGTFVRTGGNLLWDEAGRGELSYADARDLANHANEWEDGPRHIVIVLTVAHLDHVPEHCDDANLVALCQRCHNQHDAASRAAGVRERRAVPAPSLFEATA